MEDKLVQNDNCVKQDAHKSVDGCMDYYILVDGFHRVQEAWWHMHHIHMAILQNLEKIVYLQGGD